MTDRDFELKLSSGKVVTWQGKNGENAALRCAECMNVTVVAWREVAHGLFLFSPGCSIID